MSRIKKKKNYWIYQEVGKHDLKPGEKSVSRKKYRSEKEDGTAMITMYNDLKENIHIMGREIRNKRNESTTQHFQTLKIQFLK